jgi:pimeloyl-ACP methyl ester carboxylesterase
MTQPDDTQSPHRLPAVPFLLALLTAWAVLPGAAPAAAQADAREALALAYLQLELALADAPPLDEAGRASLNQAFDRATLLFFAGSMQGALSLVDSMAASVAGGGRRDAATVRARAVARLDSLNGARQSMRIAGAEVRYLLHLPPGHAPAGGWPVVVAVHGAGGDDRMFFGGYGAGSIRELADRHGVAVVTPAAPLGSTALFALVDALAEAHGLDPDRVALVGHSMGAGIVAQATAGQARRVRAVACIAGSCAAAAPASAVPVLSVAGARDPLFRVALLQEQADALRTGDRTVEFRRLDAEGHTLVVGQALPEVMEWLAARLR